MLSDRCPSCPVCAVCLSVMLVYCGQTVGWTKMKLGTEVGLGPGHIVLDRDSATPERGHSPPIFGPCPLWRNGWMNYDATWYGGRPWPRPHCVLHGDPARPRPPQKGTPPPIFGPCLLWLNGRPSQLLSSACFISVSTKI